MFQPSWWTQLCRGIRENAAVLLGIVCGGVGRRLAPFLKHFIGPWYMAQHDMQQEVAAAAKASMAAVFPGPKAQEALCFCRQQARSRLLRAHS